MNLRFPLNGITDSESFDSMDGKTLIVVISDEKELSCHHISGTFCFRVPALYEVYLTFATGTYHPSFGFSHCGNYFFGTLSMTEAEESYEEYDAQESDASNSDSGDANNTDEPNFDEPIFDNLPIDIDHGMGTQLRAHLNAYPSLSILTS